MGWDEEGREEKGSLSPLLPSHRISSRQRDYLNSSVSLSVSPSLCAYDIYRT